MQRNVSRSPVVVLAASALVLASLGCSRPKQDGLQPSASPSASASAGVAAPVASTPAPPTGKDVCERAGDPCRCAIDRGSELLTASFPERALQVTSRAPASCTSPTLLAVRSEALAAVERGEEASSLASSVLTSEPQNRFARRALAITAIHAKDFASADTTLKKLVEEDAKDADSLYYLALSQRKRDRYNGAREGFLAVLRLNPQHVDARYQLVTLTAAAGAAQEAEHDYQALLQIAPAGDPRVVAARTALNKADNAGSGELPTLHRKGSAAPAASVAPAR